MPDKICSFSSDQGIPALINGSGCHSLGEVVADLTDVTLVDEDTKSILTDNANMTIKCNQAMHVTIVWCANLLVMQVVLSGGQICKYSSSGQIWNQYNW